MERVYIDVEIEAVLEAAVARLRAHRTKPDGLLAGLAMIVGGDRTTDAIELPLLGVFPGTATPAGGPRGTTTFKVDWHLPLRLGVQVQGEPATAYPLARRLAGRALHALFTDPVGGGPEWSLPGANASVVYPLEPGNFEQPAGSGQHQDLFMARANAVAKFSTTY